MRILFAILPTALAVSGCVALDNSTPADSCKADPGQGYIGRTASGATGAELLALTNSREIRWVAPDMIVTADYKFGRLTVGYDRAMVITTVSCS